MQLFTIGYQGHTVDSLLTALLVAGATRVVDVRDNPWSPAPQWRGPALQAAVERAGLNYLHIQQAGNAKKIREWAARQAAAGAREERVAAQALERYREHLRTTPGLIVRIGMQLQDGDCLLCACRDAATCHRRVLVEELQEERQRRGGGLAPVVHIAPRPAERPAAPARQARLL